MYETNNFSFLSLFFQFRVCDRSLLTLADSVDQLRSHPVFARHIARIPSSKSVTEFIERPVRRRRAGVFIFPRGCTLLRSISRATLNVQWNREMRFIPRQIEWVVRLVTRISARRKFLLNSSRPGRSPAIAFRAGWLALRGEQPRSKGAV